VGLLCVLVAKKYTLKRNFVKEGAQKPQEQGTPMDGETKNGIPLETPAEGSDLEKGMNAEDSVDDDIVGEGEQVNGQNA